MSVEDKDNKSAPSDTENKHDSDVSKEKASDSQEIQSNKATPHVAASSANSAPKKRNKKPEGRSTTKQDTPKNYGGQGSDRVKKSTPINWSYDKYQSSITQRNLMAVLNILALSAIAVCVFSITQITKSKTLDPFIIEVDKKSGIVTLVDQSTLKLYESNEAVNDYFIIKYVKARELFDTQNYRHDYYKVARLLSDDGVYRSFTRLLRSANKRNPMQAYASNVGCHLAVRSLQYLQQDTVQVRFTVEAEMPSGKKLAHNKIAILTFKYAPIRLNESDRYINPLGFIVTSYNSDDEVLR